MKKILLLALVMFLMAFTAQAQSWTKTATISDDLSSVIVRSNGDIFVFGQNCHKSSDQGITWTTLAAISSTNESLEYSGKLYVCTDNALLSSHDGITWVTEYSEKMVICANNQYLFAFSADNFYRYDGVSWMQINSLSGIIGSSYEVYVTAAAANSDRLIIYCDHPGPEYFTPMESSDNGNSWVNLPNFYWDYVNDVAMNSFGYDNAVGGRGSSLGLNSIGNYLFNYPSGQLLTCAFIGNNCWMAGYVGVWPQAGSRGLLMADGDLSTIYFTEAPIQEISVGNTLSVAVDNAGSVYTMPVSLVTGSKQVVSKQFLSVFPNPANTAIKFYLSSKQKVEMYSAEGKLLFSEIRPEGENVINLASYSNGIIVLKIGENQAKIIKQ